LLWTIGSLDGESGFGTLDRLAGLRLYRLLLVLWWTGSSILRCYGRFCAIHPHNSLGRPIVLVVINVGPVRVLLAVIRLQSRGEMDAVLLLEFLIRELFGRRWSYRPVLVPDLVRIWSACA
jgi:hypothetical protein